jgi:aconitate hydratase
MGDSSGVRDPFHARATIDTPAGPATYWRTDAPERAGAPPLARLPVTMRVLLESALRDLDGFVVTEKDVWSLARWDAKAPAPVEVPFRPSRVVLQDFTGVPCVVDLAAMRDAARLLGGDPARVNPLVPVDLVIDHSVQVDVFGRPDALERNAEKEFERNLERYRFLHWGQRAFRNLRVVPPDVGIVHQVNLEFLAPVVAVRGEGAARAALPDTVVGTDSHTTMINGLGVLGWGVGGIEAEAVMLGQPVYLLLPQVVGVRLVGRLPEGSTATDLVLTVTQALRKKGVVDKFVEFFGPGLDALSLADRATVANMAPEYGATVGYFPVDAETLRYLRMTGRSEEHVRFVERYARAQRLFREPGDPDPEYTSVLEMDLGAVEPSLAGPKRPQDRVPLHDVARSFRKALVSSPAERGFGLPGEVVGRRVAVAPSAVATEAPPCPPPVPREIGHGAVVIAAITSCTNTSNPDVLLAAGLLARKAVERGLCTAPWVKTSLSPGSRVVTDYLARAGLTPYLERLGFHTVGYGCMTCIGNSGPLPPEVAQAVRQGALVAAAVLSGNRNFEGRINPDVKANYLASPPLVVAYAIAGSVDVDLATEPLGHGPDGRPVHLRDVWPTSAEVAKARESVDASLFARRYGDVLHANERWNRIESAGGDTYGWEASSTYIQSPPFFDGVAREPAPQRPIRAARCLLLLGDSVTTDHVSPAGDIPADGPAGRWLLEHGVPSHDFNSFGSRRGNDRVMARGTFANVRLRNLLVPGSEGGVTVHLPSGERASVFDAAERYRAEGVPLVVLAGKEYGTGSSRDWAAKGPLLLGVRAVIAESFERIHRSNLVGMGIWPLEFEPGASAASLCLTGRETFEVEGVESAPVPRATLHVVATAPDRATRFAVRSRVDTPVEAQYLRHGGILPYVLRRLVAPTA